MFHHDFFVRVQFRIESQSHLARSRRSCQKNSTPSQFLHFDQLHYNASRLEGKQREELTLHPINQSINQWINQILLVTSKRTKSNSPRHGKVSRSMKRNVKNFYLYFYWWICHEPLARASVQRAQRRSVSRCRLHRVPSPWHGCARQLWAPSLYWWHLRSASFRL